MSSETTLAKAVVEFVAKGFDKADGFVRKITESFKTMFAKAKASIDGIGKSFAGLAITSNAFFGYFSRGAMQGTSEGERFSKSMELATRAVGDMFAPVIRYATEQISKFTNIILKVDPATKNMVGGLIAVTGSLTGLLAIWPKLLPVISPVLAIFQAIVTPMGLFITAGIGVGRIVGSLVENMGNFQKAFIALAAVVVPVTAVFMGLISPITGIISLVSMAIGLLTKLAPLFGVVGGQAGALDEAVEGSGGPFGQWAGMAETAVQAALTAWDMAKQGWDSLMSALQTIWDSTGKPVLDVFQSAWQTASEFVGEVVNFLTGVVANFFGVSSEEGLTFQSVIAAIYETFLDVYSVVEMVGGLVYDFLEPAFTAVYDAVVALGKAFVEFVKPYFMVVYNAIVSGLEMIGSWFKEVSGSISFTWKDAMKFIGDLFLGVVSLVADAVNLLVWPFKQAVAAITDTLAWLGEKTGVISKATADEMRKFAEESRNFQLIDTGALADKLGKASNALDQKLKENTKTAKEMAKATEEFLGGGIQNITTAFEKNAPKAKQIVQGVKEGLNSVRGEFKKATTGGGFKMKAEIGFEGLSSTFERVQKAMANVSMAGKSVEEAQLGELKSINENMAKTANSMTVISRAVPAVV